MHCCPPQHASLRHCHCTYASLCALLWVQARASPAAAAHSLPLVLAQEVVDLIEKCMSLDPQDRPSAQQLLARLEELEELSPRGDGGGKQHAGGSGAGVKMGSGAVRPDSWEAAGSSVNSS